MGRLVVLDGDELLCRNLGVRESSRDEISLLELGQSLRIEGRFQLLKDVSEL